MSEAEPTMPEPDAPVVEGDDASAAEGDGDDDETSEEDGEAEPTAELPGGVLVGGNAALRIPHPDGGFLAVGWNGVIKRRAA